MKQTDIGGLSFPQIRERNKYYVDKTMLIANILDRGDSNTYLFTRPRRFGKTTNLSMLDAFFNMRYKGNTWFDGLEISNHPEYGEYKNAFPVIHLNLNDTKTPDYESFVCMMRDAVSDAFEPHRYVLEHPDTPVKTRTLFDSLDNGNTSENNLIASVKNLSSQ